MNKATLSAMFYTSSSTHIAEISYRKISAETEIDSVTQADLDDVLAAESNGKQSDDSGAARLVRSSVPRKRVIYGKGAIFPDYFSNTPERKYAIRIDTKLLPEAKSDDPSKRKADAAEALRQVVAAAGKLGQPGDACDSVRVR